jgi:hypothetical protein
MTATTDSEPFTCPDCDFTAPLAGGLISFHEPDCPNVCEDDGEPDEDDFDPDTY